MGLGVCLSAITISGGGMNFHIEYECETDGRWLAEVPEIPGVLTYGATEDEAVAKAETLALRVLADRIETGENGPMPISIELVAA
jgi:predicted RNase H-like HicB family nuclease